MKRALLLLLLLTACGGSDEPSAKEAYLDKAEAVCAKANTELAEAQKARPTALAGITEYVDRIVSIARTNVTDLAAIEPPADDRADLDAKVLTPLREQLTIAEDYQAKVSAAVSAKDTTAILGLVGKPPTETKADLAFMKEYGFDDCAKAADTANATK